jgi:ADP-ribose pyrophosphatase YjhB (NUDIX family)
VPFREVDARREVGLIRRTDADGSKVGWSLVGGRVLLRESLDEAVRRHVASTLGGTVQVGPVDTARPLHAAEYSPDGRFGRTDPSKHAVAMTYLVQITGVVSPGGEALDFRWFGADEIPPEEDFAYTHGEVLTAVLARSALFSQAL